ncbi:MAG: hypothetical protein LRY27_00060 [Chitinophagales bacterium]|nr:hypothetical protein [Chitinophagales bacterium]
MMKVYKLFLNRPTSSTFTSFPMCHYLIGLGKTYKLDKDANAYFKKFIEQNKGADYIKSAYHKMAWNELIGGNTSNYTSYIYKVKTTGREAIDADKQAQHEAENGNTPNINLLKIRLLTDGNYLTKAQELSNKFTVNSFKNTSDKTEYYYRMARLYDKMNQTTKAINFYKLSIENGQYVEAYFAANAAYLLGYLYEKKPTNTKCHKTVIKNVCN